MRAAPFELTFPNDRVLEGLARDVISHARADQFISDRHKAFGDALSERLRLARELHDGLLQSLTGASLQLEATLRLMETDPSAARKQLREIQELIIERQRELRAWIESVRHPDAVPANPRAELATVLETLCRRVSRWGPRVEFVGHESAAIPAFLGDHVYRLVEEGLSNVTRHAHARFARVDVRRSANSVRVLIADDGCGFPFRGRYDLLALNVRGIGPASMKERVDSLSGTLTLSSTLSGSTLEIHLPLRTQALRATTFEDRQRI